MGALTGLIEHMDWMSMLLFLMSGAACLICLTVHELAHGLAAYRLGDPTAKLNGRLTLNPLSHIDWIGLFLLMAAGVGWAKPVPVDLRNFRRPRQDMALTALAGPGSNFLLPERWYHLVLRYERYLMLAVVLLAWSGAFGGPLTAAMELVLRELCRVVQFPFALVEYYFF